MKKGRDGVTWPQANGHLEPPGPGKGRKDPPLESPWGNWLAHTLLSDFGCTPMEHTCFWSLGLWEFVTTAKKFKHSFFYLDY